MWNLLRALLPTQLKHRADADLSVVHNPVSTGSLTCNPKDRSSNSAKTQTLSAIDAVTAAVILNACCEAPSTPFKGMELAKVMVLG
jgi:hypothetical protein